MDFDLTSVKHVACASPFVSFVSPLFPAGRHTTKHKIKIKAENSDLLIKLGTRGN